MGGEGGGSGKEGVGLVVENEIVYCLIYIIVSILGRHAYYIC